MIGICDSGIGGLTVAREVMHRLPGFSILYLGDTARTPYGNKSREAVTRYALEQAEFLVQRGAKMIVVACNTMSAFAADELRSRYGIPIFEVVSPAVREALRKSPRRKIGVIGTRGTISSSIYDQGIKALNPDAEVVSAACPLFVPLVEEGMTDDGETKRIAKRYLTPLRMKQIDTLILGCTHYPFLKHIISDKIGRGVRIVDSAETSAKHLRAYLDAHPELTDALTKGNRHEWHLTDIAPHYDQIASRWLGYPVGFQKTALPSSPKLQTVK